MKARDWVQRFLLVLDSLAETIWRSQREGTPLDGAGYVAAVRNKT